MKKIATFILGTLLCVSSFGAGEKAPVSNSLLNTTAIELSGDSATSKKENFTTSMATIIDSVKSEIKDNRIKIEEISKKSTPSSDDQAFADKIFARYKIEKGNYKALLEKMVLPPTSLILAQASLESGWGKSNLAQKGNNLFGMKSFNSEEPRVSIGNIKYRKYESLRDSVKDYIINLSRHSSYQKLREAIKNGENSVALTKHLTAYSENPAYGKALVAMIKGNDFTEYDA